MSLKEKYADKIAKLLAKAESTTPEEAELLTAKAQELMAQYAIDEAMIEAARGFGGQSSVYVEEEFVVIGIYRFPLAELAQRILMVNELRCFQWSGKNPRTIDGKTYKETVVLVACGMKADVDRARALFTSLMLQAITAENHWWKENKDTYQFEAKGGHYARRQFLFSFAWGAHEKLKAAAARGKKAAEAEHTSNSVALVLLDKSALVSREFEERHPDLRKSLRSNMRAGDHAAAHAGQEAGRRADVGQPGVRGGRNALNR